MTRDVLTLAALRAGVLTIAIGLAGSLAIARVDAQQVGEKGAEAKRVTDATAVLSQVISAKDTVIPRAVLEKAEAIAVFPYVEQSARVRGQGPNTRRVAHEMGIRARGVVSVRNEKGTWSAPAFVTLNGGGRMLGDVVFVIPSRQGTDHILSEPFALDAEGVAVVGPSGPDGAQAAIAPSTEVLVYSRPREAAAKMEFKGVTVWRDQDSTQNFYGKPLTNEQAIAQEKAPEPVAAWQAALKKHVR